MRATISALEPEGNRYRFPSVRPHGGLLQFRDEGQALGTGALVLFGARFLNEFTHIRQQRTGVVDYAVLDGVADAAQAGRLVRLHPV